jgi:hypothetical protein
VEKSVDIGAGFKNMVRAVEHAGKSAILALDYITGNLPQEWDACFFFR